MPKWEYESVTILKEQMVTGLRSDIDMLNQRGQDGWELVSMVPVYKEGRFADLIAFFKRQLP